MRKEASCFQVTKECVEEGLKADKPMGLLGDMGQAVHDHAYENGYTIVREIGGHGVGKEFHEEPWVGYHSKRGTEMLLVPGMMFTIEPMVNMGKEAIYIDDENNWTVYTEDGLPECPVGDSGSGNRRGNRSYFLVGIS